MVKPGQIYFIKSANIGACLDSRPCVVLCVFGTSCLIYYISSQFDCAGTSKVKILKSDPEFPASGLKKDSYIPNMKEVEKPISELENSKLLGYATGEFKKKIEDMYGAPLA